MPADQAQRASPEALLSLAKKEGRGHLKIFLGAAPGVGKTYAMLGAGRAEIMGGRDVVAGLVETHGRRKGLDTRARSQGRRADVASSVSPPPGRTGVGPALPSLV